MTKCSRNLTVRYKLCRYQKNLIQSMIYNGDKIPVTLLQEYNENKEIVKKLYKSEKMKQADKMLKSLL